MGKFFTLLIVLSFLFYLIIPNSVQASICRNYDGDLTCILTIKRSAKYHWQYRASVSINGKKTPIEIYNCREKIKTKKNGKRVPFDEKGAGKLICTILN